MDRVRVARELVRLAKDLSSAFVVTDRDLKAISRLTDSNAHTDALIYLCDKILGDKKAVKGLKLIKSLHALHGSLPHDLYKFRYNEYYKPAMAKVERVFDKETAQKIYYSF